MRQYKKKLIAISLASVMTVLGAFGNDNYLNTIKSLDFKSVQNKTVMTVYTEKHYSMPLVINKTSSNFYEIILRDTNCDFDPSSIQYGPNIKNVRVSTTPYTPEDSGKTRISVETFSDSTLDVQTATFIPASQDVKMLSDTTTSYSSNSTMTTPPKAVPKKKKSYWDDEPQTTTVSKKNIQSQKQQSYDYGTSNSYKYSGSETNTTNSYSNNVNTPYDNTTSTTNNTKLSKGNDYSKSQELDKTDTKISNSEPMSRLMAMTGFLLIAFLIMVVFFISKERMASVIGEQAKYNFDDDKKPERRTPRRTQPVMNKPLPKPENKTSIPNPEENYSYNNEEPAEEPANILDLDQLYTEMVQSTPEQDISEPKEVQDSEEDENTDLDEFLNNFSFDEEQLKSENNDATEDEAASENDTLKIDNLENYNAEIDIVENDELSAIIENENPEPETVQLEIIPEKYAFDEELYEQCINDDSIAFSEADAAKIDSLLLVELTEDLLQTYHDYMRMLEEKKNAPTQEQMLENFISTYFVKQNITFNNDDISALQRLMSVELDEDFVKDLHTNPIRTKEMAKEISERESKPHKTSEIQILGVKDLLPDLSMELKKYGNKRIRSEARPQVVYFSEGYEYTKLSVDSELLDLSSEANKNEPNVFRPSDFPPIVESGYEVQTLDVASELPDLEDVKANPEKYEDEKSKKSVPDEQALINSLANVTFKPFYEEILATKVSELELSQSVEETKKTLDSNSVRTIERKTYTPKQKTERTLNAQKIIESYSAAEKTKAVSKVGNAEQRTTGPAVQRAASPKPKMKEKTIPQYPQSCVYEGYSYKVVNAVSSDGYAGCYLAKSQNGYTVFGFAGDKLYKLNDYSELKSENIQIRVNEKKPDGTVQYIVKVSTHKFLMKLVSDRINLVMNLC